MNEPWKRKALLQETDGENVRCGLCERRCSIPPGQAGFCKTRINKEGVLYTLVYGNISSLSANPAEKKPFFHFLPGELFLTAGSYSCNFTCPWCQNWEISKSEPEIKNPVYISPERFVKMCELEKCKGTSLSFNEPTLMFEYAIDLFPLAKRKGLKNTFVSNGYMTLKALQMLKEAGLDAINFDVKGDKQAVREYCQADVDVVWRNIKEAKKLGLHVEVTNLIVPDVNDSKEKILELIRKHLQAAGADTPLHFTRYYPAYMFQAPPTQIRTLETARELAVREGVNFAYIGNVPGHKYENTYCPKCGTLLIERLGLSITKMNLTDSFCPKCGRDIPIVIR